MELVHTQIENDELMSKKSIDISGNESDNIIIRRIFWMLSLPIKSLNKDKVDFDFKKRERH